MAKERKCIVCSKRYEWCNTCRGYDHSKRWKATYCSEDCKEIFDICSRYVGNSISKEEAYNKLIKTNINNIDKQISIKHVAEEILSYKPPIKEEPKVVETPIVQDEVESVSVLEEYKEPISEEIKVEEVETPNYRRSRRRRKKNIEE